MATNTCTRYKYFNEWFMTFLFPFMPIFMFAETVLLSIFKVFDCCLFPYFAFQGIQYCLGQIQGMHCIYLFIFCIFQCVSDSRSLPNSPILIVKNYPEMTDWVHPIQKHVPFYSSNKNYTKIAVDSVEASDGEVYNVLLLATGMHYYYILLFWVYTLLLCFKIMFLFFLQLQLYSLANVT